MKYMKLAALAVLLALLVGSSVSALSAPLGDLLGKNVKVTLQDGTTYQGLVTAETAEAIVLQVKNQPGKKLPEITQKEGGKPEVKVLRSDITEVRLVRSGVTPISTSNMLLWLASVLVAVAATILIMAQILIP